MSTVMYETEAWSQGIQLDEREEMFEQTSMEVIGIWNAQGEVMRVFDAVAARRREAQVLVSLNEGWVWAEGDYWLMFPTTDTPGSAPLMGTQPEDDCWQGAAGVVIDVLWAQSLLTTGDKIEFTWEAVTGERELSAQESEARWVEARADGECDLSLLMMEVPA